MLEGTLGLSWVINAISIQSQMHGVFEVFTLWWEADNTCLAAVEDASLANQSVDGLVCHNIHPTCCAFWLADAKQEPAVSQGVA